MKHIVYRNIVEFNLPDHWVSEEDNGIGVFYEQGDEVSTLRVELLIAKSPSPVDENTHIEMLKALSRGNGEIRGLGYGVACKRHLEEMVDQGQKITIHYWYLSSAKEPDMCRLVTFSFTTLSRNKTNEETQQILGMLDREIRSCKFIN